MSPYLSAGSGSGGASPYLTAGSAYADATPNVAGSVSASNVPAIPSGRPTLPGQSSSGFGEIGHLLAKTGEGLVSDVYHAPGGVQKLIGDAATSIKQQFEPSHMGKPSALTQDIANAATATKESFAHPLRHPDQTLLNLFAIGTAGAGAAERLALAGEAAKAGDAGGVVKALVTKPVPVTRLISHDGYTVKLPAAANPLTRIVQKTTDRLRQAFPNTPVLGAAKVVGRANAREIRLNERSAEVPVATMMQKAREAGMLKQSFPGRYTSDALARQHAVRVVAEGVPTDLRIARHQDLMDNHLPSKATDPAIRAMRDSTFVKGHQEQIGLNQATKQYVAETGAKPRLNDPKMQAAYDQMLKVSGNREALLGRLNKLTPETAAGRLNKPGAFFTGNEDFSGGEMRVPTTPAFKGLKSTGVHVGSSQGIAEVKAPGSLTHAYTGAAYRGGKIRTDVVRQMAESALEAQKFWTLLHVTDHLKAAAKDVPTSTHDIPMVVEHLPGRPSLAEATARLQDEQTAPGAMATMSHGYEGLRQAIFPNFVKDNRGFAVPTTPIPGVKYVDERLLGGLNKPNPLLGFSQHTAGRATLATVDALNNASKIAILYLKPAYIAPNLLSNLTMNFVQQGFAAPVNLARAARLWAKADPETVNYVLANMGHGKLSVLDAEAGVAAKAAHAAAGFWQKPVDVLPRLASFLYEARRDEITNATQLKQLFTDPALADKLSQIRLRANQEMIDFGDLSPIERAIVSRVVFFYPWVKGSAKWLGRYPVEHPVQAGSLGQLGRIGQQAQQNALGSQIPSWALPLIPVGTGPHGLPQTYDPFTVTPFVQTPGLAQSLGAILSGHPGEAASSVGSMLSPAGGFVGTAAGKGLPAAVKGLYANLPLVTEAQQAMGKSSKTYPYEGTALDAFLRYVLGTGMVPRETSPAELEKSAYYQLHPPKR